MKEWKKLCSTLTVLILLATALPSSAQSEPTTSEPTASEMAAESNVDMADAMRQNGKIYVVVAIIMVLFAGFIAYTVRIDQKVNQLEKALKDQP